jgi:hypothetical protein
MIAHAIARDHPRAAGLARHLGAVLELPSIGVTDRPLQAIGPEPGPERGETSRLLLDGVETARMLRTRAGARPLVVHAGWRTDLDTAISVALASTGVSGPRSRCAVPDGWPAKHGPRRRKVGAASKPPELRSRPGAETPGPPGAPSPH